MSNINKFLEALTQEQAQYAQTTRSEIHQLKTDITAAIHEAQLGQSGHSSGTSPDQLSILSSVQKSLAKLVEATQVVAREDVILQRLWFPELGNRERTIETPHKNTFRWLLYDSDLPNPGSQVSEGKVECVDPKLTGAPSPGRDACSGQSAGSVDENDAMSFRTALNWEDIDDSDDLKYSKDDSESCSSQDSTAPSVLARSKESRRLWREQRKWRNQKRRSFLKWLRTEDGIFYCSGKAGSGKSTLMKFLAHERRTREELSFWSRAKEKTLILSHFFFWSSGTPLQRSLEGLYRGMIWDILRQCPNLIPVVFPAVWSCIGVREPASTFQPFTMGELESAMDRLFLDEAVTSSHRICLFIDGLDEYEGDYWKFAKSIKIWAASSKDVKFCLSSRPYGTFLRHFASDETSHLRLHDLTRADMYRFVSDQSREDERYTAIEDDIHQEFDFLRAIVDRSDGIFLWVRLVTVELLSGIEDNCSIPQLIKRLDSIPVGLKNMFQKMMDSIHTTEQQRAAQMFLTMTHGSTFISTVSTMVFVQAVLDDFADDPRLAVSLLSTDVGPYLSSAACIKKCHTAGHRAIARCKGLVEVVECGVEFPHCHQLSFVHRSVGDFFKDDETQLRLRSAAGNFCLYRSLFHAVLTCIKLIDPNESLECPHYATGVKTTTVTSRRIRYSLFTEGPFSDMPVLLSIVRCAELDGVPPMTVEVDSMISMLRQTTSYDHNGGRVFRFPRPLFYLGTDYYWGPIPTRDVRAAVVSYGICIKGMTETAIELISSHPDLLALSPGKHHVFLSAALRDLYDVYDFGNDISRTRILIERASSSINADCSDRCKMGRRGDSEGRKTIGLQFSTWTAFLLALSQLMIFEILETPSNCTGISALLELFLQHGADPHVVFIGYNFATPTDNTDATRTKGPFYTDLLGMMKFLKLVPTKATMDMLNVAPQKQHHGWIRRSLGDFPWVARQKQPAYEKMSPLEDKIGDNFIPLSIIPCESLASISWGTLQETADWIHEQGSEDFEFSFDV